MDQQFEHSCCLNVSLSHSGFTVRVITPVLDCQYSTLSHSVGHNAEYMWLRSALLFDCQSVILRINKESTVVIWLFTVTWRNSRWITAPVCASGSHFLLLLLFFLRDLVIGVLALVLATVHVLSELVFTINSHIAYAAVVASAWSAEVGVVSAPFAWLLGLNGHYIMLLTSIACMP